VRLGSLPALSNHAWLIVEEHGLKKRAKVVANTFMIAAECISLSLQATLRVVYSYFMDIDRELVPRQAIPLHTVIKITYDGWMNCTEERFELGPDVPETVQHEGVQSTTEDHVSSASSAR
jgi:hypothetical protein